MYNGNLLDELTAMVARAEVHAREVEAQAAMVTEEAQAYYFTSRYTIEPAQPALLGVA